MDFLPLACPLCGNVVAEIEDVPGVRSRGRCRNRHCRDKPRVTWQVTDQHTVVLLVLDVDRAAPGGVGFGQSLPPERAAPVTTARLAFVSGR